MVLNIEEKKAIIEYRIQKSDDTFIEAKDNAVLKHWNLTANRLYYSLFHLVNALMVKSGYNIKSHAGLITVLGKEFVLNGMLTKEDAKLSSRLLNMRNAGDYDDMFDWEEEDIMPLFPKVEALLLKLKTLLT